MKEADDKGPARAADPPPDARAKREARLAKALRENLRRRKGGPQDKPDRPSGN